ncbi:hypothetical protein ASPVEDRAFT_247865 [Aspergillus versicolor CBS 583.65]|uniref:Uncharacterized protein n=1 Tax=Aspergillus versicolor CBS 583.65 TaxID=1036611 RepID=A0A1L9P5F4_ASPVE|nr:uncharacterized protein ASPVEDRAFT_247865 [Aspergillus versicolor CBS 583.65]OJI96653.1 hypothetical protein ASPVEDRAFT_247865 [Aspergillus versicolor CBS 583.65]
MSDTSLTRVFAIYILTGEALSVSSVDTTLRSTMVDISSHSAGNNQGKAESPTPSEVQMIEGVSDPQFADMKLPSWREVRSAETTSLRTGRGIVDCG